jgi:serine/threonine protein kinase
MAGLVCKGCGGAVDATGIDPFTVCECSECGAELVIPLQMDYISLERPVGEKAFFEIYDGFDGAHNLNAIIYLLTANLENVQECAKFAKEQAVELSTLKHPNICPLINFGEVEGRFFVTTPKLDGYPMSTYQPQTQGLLDIGSVVDVMQAAALGLGVAHHKEFVHHNVCAETVHIDARGNVRTKDWFISRWAYELESKNEMKSSVSPFFISPEKAESGVEDKRGDVFSLGVLFYFLLTGSYPFVGASEVETVYSRVKKKKKDQAEIFSSEKPLMATPETVEYVPPQAPIEVRPDIPEPISAMVMDMLSYLPVHRPKISEVLNSINLHKAKEYQEKAVFSAQKKMVETKTRAIPMMKNLYDTKIGGDKDKEKDKKKRIFFR